MSDRIMQLCLSHQGSRCERHPHWPAVACWCIVGIFHRPMCAECKKEADRDTEQ